MDVKRYSLNDIFAILNEATQILQKEVTVVSEDLSGNNLRTNMMLSEFIAMSVATQLTDIHSRVASDDTTASEDDVISALKANYYDEKTYPIYKGFGIIMRGGRKTRRNKRRTFS
jgi:hypothetical protein